MGSRSSSIRQQCKASATRVADRAMSYRFVQQFVALLYKNGALVVDVGARSWPVS